MTDKPLPEDAPILRCVAKKSLQVISKIGLAIGCIAVVLILAYVIVESVINFFVAIPLGAWILIGPIATILTYSYLWCVARRFTDEDWKSEYADASALASALAVDPVDKITIWYYVFRFGGAWINYRKRMKAAATQMKPGSE